MKQFSILVAFFVLSSSVSMANRYDNQCRGNFRQCINARKDQNMCLSELDSCEYAAKRDRCKQLIEKTASHLIYGKFLFPFYITASPITTPAASLGSSQYAECILQNTI